MTERKRSAAGSALPFRIQVQHAYPDAWCSLNKPTGRYIVHLHGKPIGHGGTAAAAWRDAWRNI